MLQQASSLSCRLGKQTLGREPALALREGGQHRHGAHQDPWQAPRGERDDEGLDLGGGGTGTASACSSTSIVSGRREPDALSVGWGREVDRGSILCVGSEPTPGIL